MAILSVGLSIFFMAIIIHVVVWRTHRDTRGIKLLLRIFLWTLIMTIFFLYLIQLFTSHLNYIASKTFLDYLQICIFFISLSLAYTSTYSAAEAESPTALMINKVVKAGKDGLTKDEFEKAMTDEILIKPRIKDLLDDKMIFMTKNRYKLTMRGFLFVKIFILYRDFLNLPKGG